MYTFELELETGAEVVAVSGSLAALIRILFTCVHVCTMKCDFIRVSVFFRLYNISVLLLFG